MKAKKSLGQHFLHNKQALLSIVNTVSPQKGETILEIGPGKGALTEELLATGAQVVAIEADEELYAYNLERFASYIENGQFVLFHGDFLETDLKKIGLSEHSFSVIANIPYYITGQIIRRLLSGPIQPKNITLLVQKEIAERAVAKDNKESLLSISIRAYGTPKMGKIVKAGAFNPPPKVDSAILTITDISRDFFNTFSEETFFELLRAHFGHKRKQLKGSGLFSEKTFATCDVNPTARPETLSIDDWKCLVSNR